MRIVRTFALTSALMLTTWMSGCSGGGHATSAIPAVVSPGASQPATMTVTVKRQAANAESVAGRQTLTIPANANSVAVAAYTGTLPLPAAGSEFAAPRGTTTASTSCADFPAGQTQTTVTIQVPIGPATVVIRAYSGKCSGNLAQGTILSEAAGTGTATPAGGDLGTTFFHSNSGVALNVVQPSTQTSAHNPAITITDANHSLQFYSKTGQVPDTNERDLYCFFGPPKPRYLQNFTISVIPQVPNTYRNDTIQIDPANAPAPFTATVNGAEANVSSPVSASFWNYTDLKDTSPNHQVLLPTSASYNIVTSGMPYGAANFDFERFWIFTDSGTYAARASAYTDGISCPTAPFIGISDLTQPSHPRVNAPNYPNDAYAATRTKIDLLAAPPENDTPLPGFTLKSIQWNIEGKLLTADGSGPLDSSALTTSEVAFQWDKPGIYAVNVSAIYADAAGKTLYTQSQPRVDYHAAGPTTCPDARPQTMPQVTMTTRATAILSYIRPIRKRHIPTSASSAERMARRLP